MEYLQNASKRIQRQFHKHWTAYGQSLHAKRYACTSRFYVHTHDQMTLRCMFDGCINVTFE